MNIKTKKPNMLFYFVAMLLFVTIRCQDQNSPLANENLINEPIKVIKINTGKDLLISDSEYAEVKKLFNKNSLSLSNLQVLWFLDSYDSSGGHNAFCYQTHKDLLIFENPIIFKFNNEDIYYELIGKLHNNLDIDTIPGVSANIAGEEFFKEITSDVLYTDSLESFKNEGLIAELGFYDLNFDYYDHIEKFILVWEFRIANGTKYPTAMIRADSLSFIYYSSRAPVR